jgi:hypothetical protein
LVPKGKAYHIQDSPRITHIRRPLPLLYAVIVVVSPSCSARPKEFLSAEEDLPAPATLLSPVLVSAAGNIFWAVSHSHSSSLHYPLSLILAETVCLPIPPIYSSVPLLDRNILPYNPNNPPLFPVTNEDALATFPETQFHRQEAPSTGPKLHCSI